MGNSQPRGGKVRDYTISLDLVIQALIVFEGLSLWKLSDFAAQKNSASLVGKNLGDELSSRWKRMRRNDNFPWFDLFMAFVLLIVWPMCKTANILVWVLRWTPYLFGTIGSLMFIGYHIWHVPPVIPPDWTIYIAKSIFWFIAGKLLINLLTPVINRIPFSQVNVEIPSGMIDNIKR